MNKRLTKAFSFTVIVLLALGEGSQLVNAVTEETTSSTAANEKVLPAQDTVDSAEKTTTSSSEVAKEATTSRSEEATTESTTEKSEETEKKKEKSKATRAADDPVNIPDNNLYQMFREILNRPAPSGANQTIPDGTAITEKQMAMVKIFNRTSLSTTWDSQPISNLEGIQYATNLEEFILDGKHVTDSFTSLPADFGDLKNLKVLKFSEGTLSNIDELKDHPTLTTFSIDTNNLDSLQGLSGCTELEYVNLKGNEKIQNFQGLEKSTKLKEVRFNKSDEAYGSTLAKVDAPEASYVGYGLQSLDGLKCKDTLELLELSGHPGLHALSGLENYSNLRELTVTGASTYNGRSYYYDNPGGVDDIVFDTAVHTQTYHKRGLRGPTALDALSNCTSLVKVNLSKQAIEDISPLAGKSAIKELNIGVNLVETLQPLATTNNLVKLFAENNLLRNLNGLEAMSSLEYLDVSNQSAGAVQMVRASYQQNIKYYLKGLLADISALNSTSLVELRISDNRLDDISSLKNATHLNILTASNNYFSDIKGDLVGCSSLSKVNFNNNQFVNFNDTGLGDAKDSLKELYLSGQGKLSNSAGNMSSTDALLENLDGLKNFTIIEKLDVSSNQIKDGEMNHIPDCIIELNVSFNDLQDKAFSTFTPASYTRLREIFGESNHISDITPLESFTSLTRVYIPRQSISVPKQGGKFTKKTSPVGFEVDVLKSNQGKDFTFSPKSYWLSGVVPTLKTGTYIFDVDDPDYSMEGRNPSIDFKFGGNNTINGLTYDGSISVNVDYDIATTASLELVPTDIDGNEITEITPGGLIYWRATVDSSNENHLIKPNFGNYLFSNHQLANPYTEASDLQAPEYVNGARVEINKTYVATPEGIWNKPDALTNMINKSKVATITIVTKVYDNATVGEVAKLRLYFSGKNFSEVASIKEVLIKAKVPEVINLSAPDRFDFGKGNEATKTAKIYKPDAKAYSAKEQTDGFNVRVTDTRQGASRTDWKVVAQLSDLTNSKSTALKAGSVAPTLSLRDISLYKMDLGAGTETSIAHGSTGNPTWDQDILLTAGGSSVKVTGATSANGEGVWDYRIPFNKVELNVPSNVNDQAGYTFNGKLTWTLDNTL